MEKRNLGRDAVLTPSQSILATNYEKKLKIFDYYSLENLILRDWKNYERHRKPYTNYRRICRIK